MKKENTIELIFADGREAVEAYRLAKAMIFLYCQFGYRFLPFDDMHMVDQGGWWHYPSRQTDRERTDAFTALREKYLIGYRRLIRCDRAMPERLSEAEEIVRQIKRDGNRLLLNDCDRLKSDRDIRKRFFEEFFTLLCMILAASFPDSSFEGMRRIYRPDSYEKRRLIHAVSDPRQIVFEQMIGDPVYDTDVVTWTRSDGELVSHGCDFPSIRVDIVTDDCDSVKQDEEINRWVESVNDVKMTMVSAELCIFHPSFNPYPNIMLRAPSWQLCVQYRDALRELLAGKGYQSKVSSILWKEQCVGSHIVIPDGVTMIGDSTFFLHRSLKSVVIPENVTRIGECSFRECHALEEVDISDSVTEIDGFAFSECTALKRIKLSKNLKKLSVGVFCGCDNLGSIEIPARVTSIERFAFSHCEGLTTVVIPERVSKIGEEAFLKCRNLQSVTIPEGVKTIEKDAFRDCHPDLVIYGKKDTEAKRYARENNITFETIK